VKADTGPLLKVHVTLPEDTCNYLESFADLGIQHIDLQTIQAREKFVGRHNVPLTLLEEPTS